VCEVPLNPLPGLQVLLAGGAKVDAQSAEGRTWLPVGGLSGVEATLRSRMTPLHSAAQASSMKRGHA